MLFVATLVGFLGGIGFAKYWMQEKWESQWEVEREAELQEIEAAELSRKRRELHDAKRSVMPREGVVPAVVHKARTSKRPRRIS